MNFDRLHAWESGHAGDVGAARGVASHDESVHGVVEIAELVHLES